MSKCGFFKAAGFAALAAVGTMSTIASAATVVYEDVGFLGAGLSNGGFPALSTGVPEAGTTKVNSFSIAQAGTYTVKLADFVFPESFQAIGLSITSFVDDQLSLGSIVGPGSFNFNASSPGTYYASVFGQAGSTFGLGLYGVQVTEFGPAAVPLPSAVLFLLSGLAVFAAFGRGGKSENSDPSTAFGLLPTRGLAA